MRREPGKPPTASASASAADSDARHTPAPAASNAPDASPDSAYRCSTPVQLYALLCELRDSRAPVVLSSPQGTALRSGLWEVDVYQKRLVLDVDARDPMLPALVEGNECTAVAYLQQVKLQFDLDQLMLLHGAEGSVLQARMPEHVYRFQRRQAFRVPTLERPAPTAELRHPDMPDMRLSLRILDISAGGCALQLPLDVPPLPLGIVLDGVKLHLDAGTQLTVRLRMQHAGSIGGRGDGLRLGCELVQPAAHTLRELQRHVDQLQRQRRMLALG